MAAHCQLAAPVIAGCTTLPPDEAGSMTEVLRHIDLAAQTNGHLLALCKHRASEWLWLKGYSRYLQHGA